MKTATITHRRRTTLRFALAAAAVAALVGGVALWKYRAPALGAAAEPASRPARAAVPPRLTRLFAEMEAVGPENHGKYEEGLRAFLASTPDPLATLEEAYAALSPDATTERWKTAFAAREIPTAASVRFLERLAVGPTEVVPARHATSSHSGGVTDRSYHVRATATIGVVKHHLKGVEGAEAAVAKILASAEPDMAQTAGLELFAEGRLTDEHRAALAARNISSGFRRLAGAELDQIRTLTPTDHPGQQQADEPPAKGP
jgi:hypothetical protein